MLRPRINATSPAVRARVVMCATPPAAPWWCHNARLVPGTSIRSLLWKYHFRTARGYLRGPQHRRICQPMAAPPGYDHTPAAIKSKSGGVTPDPIRRYNLWLFPRRALAALAGGRCSQGALLASLRMIYRHIATARFCRISSAVMIKRRVPAGSARQWRQWYHHTREWGGIG